MPKLVERLVHQLQARGMDKSKSYAVAIKKMQEAGNLKPGTTALTEQGKKRQAMGAAGRAIDREVKRSGAKPSELAYSKKTNRATRKG